MKPLTKSQQKVFDYIRSCAQEFRIPSVREICAATGLSSTSTVHLHLKTLEERGLIEREKGLNRSIRISGEEQSTPIPVMGRVTAGLPILAVEDIECYVPVAESIRRGRELFALRVMGESMINAGILDGDEVIVAQQNTAKNGDMVVALLGDSATVKTFYKENGYIRLQPENTLMDPIIVYGDLTILGKVIGIMRFIK